MTLIDGPITSTAIRKAASDIAGASWDDRDRTGTLADQLRACRDQPVYGADGDLDDDDRANLDELARLCDYIDD